MRRIGQPGLQLASAELADLERAAWSLNTSVLEGCDAISGWERATNSHPLVCDGAHPFTRTDQTAAVLTCSSAAGDACQPPHAQHAHQAHHTLQQGDEALLGLACHSVLQVGVANSSTHHSFQVWLSRDTAANSPPLASSGPHNPTLDGGVVNKKGWGGEIERCSLSGREPSATTNTHSGSTTTADPGTTTTTTLDSPPMVLKPGQSTLLFAYLQATHTTHGRTAYPTAVSASSSNSTPAPDVILNSSASSRASAPLTAQAHTSALDRVWSGGDVSKAAQHRGPEHSWRPSGGDPMTAARTAAGMWVVRWRQVVGGEGAGTHSGDAGVHSTQGTQSAHPAQGTESMLSEQGSASAEQQVPNGMAWLAEADLVKVCARICVLGGDSRYRPCITTYLRACKKKNGMLLWS